MKDPWDQLPTARLAAFATQVAVHTPTYLHTLLASTDKKSASFALWQPGVLHPFGPFLDTGNEHFLGGLTRERTRCVLVPASLVDARRAAWLEQLARAEMVRLHLPIDDLARVQAYCDQARQEILEERGSATLALTPEFATRLSRPLKRRRHHGRQTQYSHHAFCQSGFL